MTIEWEQISVPLPMGGIFTRIGGRPSDSPVVLVHGFVLAGDYMMPAARILSAFSTTYVPDLPGYGLSGKPPQRLDLPFLGDCLAEWMERLKLCRAHFIGNSFGCQILVDFAARHARFVHRLVLQGPTVDPAARSLGKQLLRLARNSRIESPGLGRLMLRDYWRAGCRSIAAAVRMALRDCPEAMLPKISAPTLVVRGSDDVLVPQGWAERIVHLLPNGHLLVLPGLAHTINYTAPARFVDAIRPFLRL
jgi:2-hydroxy-6-oxonona-2,4-dienedioate hydrolase